MVYWQRYSTADTGSLRPDRFAPGVLSMCMRYCDREVADSLGLGRSRVLFPVSERFDALGPGQDIAGALETILATQALVNRHPATSSKPPSGPKWC